MDDEEAVEPQAEQPIDQIMDEVQDAPPVDQEDNSQAEMPEKTMVPLSVAQKLRETKKELELQLQWERQERLRLMETRQAPAELPVEDNSRYESATKEDLMVNQRQIVRYVEENQWIKNNPEKAEFVDQNLLNFLKQRPNLTSAVNGATNRYEEAYTLMEALSPKQKQQLARPQTVKKEAPNAPGGVPKAAAMDAQVDIMNMDDKEFQAWRASKRTRR